MTSWAGDVGHAAKHGVYGWGACAPQASLVVQDLMPGTQLTLCPQHGLRYQPSAHLASCDGLSAYACMRAPARCMAAPARKLGLRMGGCSSAGGRTPSCQSASLSDEGEKAPAQPNGW